MVHRFVTVAFFAAIGVASLLPAAGAATDLAQQRIARDAGDFVALTDDSPHDYPGCDAITVASTRDGLASAHGGHRLSPGQLTGTSSGDLLLSLSSNNGLFLAVFDRRRGQSWESYYIDDDGNPGDWSPGSAVAVSPDDQIVLVGRMGGVEKFRTADIQPGARLRAPLGVAMIDDSGSLGWRATGPGEIVFSRDSRLAYIVATNGYIHFLDVERMVWTRSPVEYVPTTRTRSWFRMRRTFAALSTDGKQLVVNTGTEAPSQLNVVDVSTGAAWLLDQPAQAESWGVAFGHDGHAAGTLAVHGRTSVAVYRWALGESLPVLATWRIVPAQNFDELVDWGESLYQRIGALAWFGDGSGLVAAKGGRTGPEWELLDYHSGEITLRGRMDSCVDLRPPSAVLEPFDVFTLHRPPSNSPTPAPTVAKSPVPATPTPTRVTSPVVPRVTETATVPPSDMPISARVYLPAMLREECVSHVPQVDFALVVDASTSMIEQQTNGRTKLELAADAAGGLVELLGPDDRAAVVSFNVTAQLLQDLTADKRKLMDALYDIDTQELTRIDLGIATGHSVLVEGRSGDRAPVMIVLTDGRANPVPVDIAIEAAAAAKSDGVTIFTIGLGPEHALDIDGLIAMSSGSGYFFHAPDAEELLSIYQTVAEVADRCW